MPPCAIDFTSRFTTQVRDLSRARRDDVDELLQRLSATFGQMHLHSGLGIRRLRRNYFECRLDRDLRIIFKLEGDTLIMVLLGSHDDVRKFIKQL